jgi:pyruvate dehydrogenase E2 component (dihydrolipoamide acetyltransferase)
MDFRMPSLGADMDVGTVVEWRIRPGDAVRRGDIVAVVQTDKADIEVEVFADGTVDELLVVPGDEVAVGTPLARLSPAGALTPAAAAPAAAAPVAPVAPPPERKPPERRPAAPGAPKTWSPLVRHLAEARHVDLAGVVGSGPGGSIRRVDVEQAPVALPLRASPRAKRLAVERHIDLAKLAAAGSGSGPGGAWTGDDVLARQPKEDRRASQRRAVGALMARSKREIPHYYLATDVDVSAPLAFLDRHNAGLPPPKRVLPAALILRAVARAIADVPGFSGHYLDPGPGFVPADELGLGVAVALRQGGLIAPVLTGAARLGLDDLMTALRDLVARARSGRLRGAEMADATITVTNLGERGASAVYGVIVPPQVAIVGVGRVEVRPWVVDGGIVARPVVTITLSGDHRVTSGHEGSRFLEAIATHLRTPEDL